MKIEFINYTGKYPRLCVGTLVLSIDGEIRTLENCLSSGGCIICNKDNGMINYEAVEGEWELMNIPIQFLKYKSEIQRLVNENVELGCCGGCI